MKQSSSLLFVTFVLAAGFCYISMPVFRWNQQGHVKPTKETQFVAMLPSGFLADVKKDAYLTLDQATDAFSYKFKSGCANDKDVKAFCPVWEPKGTCEPARTPQQLFKYITDKSPPVPLVGKNQYFFEFEKTLLQSTQLQDLNDLPSLNLSMLVVLGHQEVKAGVIKCSVGEKVKVRADLVNGHGHSRKEGYDDVRGWMVQVTGGKGRASADVTDLRNGSYVVSFRCLWPGSKTKLHIGVPYPREYLRRVLQERRLGIMRLVSGEYRKGNVREATTCYSTPNLPWPCLCNHSDWNNAPFYCGRPLDPKLSCSDLYGTASAPSPHRDIESTPAEIQMLKTIAKAPILTRIHQDLYLQTSPGAPLAVPQPCQEADPTALWNATEPKGWWDENLGWHSLLCRNEVIARNKVQECLSHSHVMVFGDSNGVRIQNTVNGLMQASCRKIGAVTGLMWNVHTVCRRLDKDFTLTFDPHEHHLYLSGNFWPIQKLGDVAHNIDRIPASGRYIVIVHYYLHMLGAHMSVVYNRLLALKEAIKRVKSRNKDVVIAFRGPHIIAVEWPENHSMGGDVQGLLYYRLVKEVFEDIKDKVIFLDGWGMSIALENKDVHPTNQVPQAMIQSLLSYICK